MHKLPCGSAGEEGVAQRYVAYIFFCQRIRVKLETP